ncbi:MAG: inositol monophosphatase family protein [Syntrophales bacterium]|nr:inositol monophosphatase family protein [Syntrophales bacterium]
MPEQGDFAISIARIAGSLLRDRFKEKHQIDYKGEIDIVTEADRMSEEMLIAEINRKFPDHNILSEEAVEMDRGSRYRWIIDPLDGTTNYAHGFPMFCVSIALEKDGQIITGVIYSPVSDELFVAGKGKGAFLDGSRILVSGTTEISKSLLATGFPYDIRRDPNNNINYFSEMALRAQAIRRAGSAALDLAYTAAGCFDGFWELKLRPWDTAAGWLLVSEAGGVITDISGGSYGLDSPSMLASNGKIHDDMIRILDSINPADSRLP